VPIVLRPIHPQLFVNNLALINSIVGSLQYLKNAYIIQSGRACQLLIQPKELIKMTNKENKLDDE